jgi:hypothetical protein
LAALFVTAAMALRTTAIAQAPPGSLWYNGDFNGVNGLSNGRNTLVTQAAVYDDFNVTAPLGWNVTALFSDNLVDDHRTITGADWEIRTGVSEGNAGTLVASGSTNSPLVSPTGRGNFEQDEYMVEVIGLNLFLPMLPSGQHYWLNVTPVGNGTGRFLIRRPAATTAWERPVAMTRMRSSIAPTLAVTSRPPPTRANPTTTLTA